MSLLDILASSLGNSSQQGGQAGQSGQAALIAAALEFVNNQPGGIMGLIQRFHQNGAGDIVQSWIGTGENKPISPGLLTNVLGADNVGALAHEGHELDGQTLVHAEVNVLEHLIANRSLLDLEPADESVRAVVEAFAHADRSLGSSTAFRMSAVSVRPI